ncbi:MAG: hypothetical protein ACI4E1_14070 [Lachnospira sp.]
MIKRKFTKNNFFTVEDETEKWYLEWLRNIINDVLCIYGCVKKGR